jgi:hypothetical protein
MAAIQAATLIRRAARQGGIAAALLVAALAGGCATTEEFFSKTKATNGPAIGQVACLWQNTVRFVPDPTRNGEPNAGIAGRLWLFDPDLTKPVEGDGSVAVFLYDETRGEPVMLEAWVFDPQTLKRLQKKDPAGPGYTLFLPWEKYRPDITKIRLRVRYQPAKGAPQFTEDAITLAPDNGVIRKMNDGPPFSLTSATKKGK